jgi:hypothetical protein
LTQYEEKYDPKQAKKHHIPLLVRLDEKLSDTRNPEVDEAFEAVLFNLERVDLDRLNYKAYFKSVSYLKKVVKDELDFVEKGSIQAKYSSFGVIFGVVLGTIMMSVNPAFLGMYIAIGVAIGSGTGSSKEKEAVKAGRVY